MRYMRLTSTSRNNEIFSFALVHLLHILGLQQHVVGKGLTLEITAFSPSDNEHEYYFYELDESFPFLYEDDLERGMTLDRHYKSSHDIRAGPRLRMYRRIHFHTDEHIARFNGTPLSFPLSDIDLPKVPLVTRLLLRQRVGRALDTGTMAQLMRKSLVGLRALQLERKDLDHSTGPDLISQVFLEMMPFLPPTLESVSLHQSKLIHRLLPGPAKKRGNVGHTLALAFRCFRLREFGAGTEVDPFTFFETLARMAKWKERYPPIYEYLSSFDPQLDSPYPWGNLELLCLSENLLGSEDHMDGLLSNAASSLALLPKLRMMELWANAPGSETAYLFQYRIEPLEGQPRIMWRSCFHPKLTISDEVIQRWDNAARHSIYWRHKPLVFTVLPLQWNREETRLWEGRILYQKLKLRRLVGNPITLAQMESEVGSMQHR